MINNTIALADHVPRCHLVYHRLKLTLSHATQRTLRRALASAAPSWDSLSPPHLPMQFSAAVVIMAGFAASRTVSARLVASPRYECDADGFRFLYFIVIFSTHPTATLVYSAVPTTSPRLRLSLHCSWFSQHNLHIYTRRSSAARELRLPTTSPSTPHLSPLSPRRTMRLTLT